jgi:hypothetical protein
MHLIDRTGFQTLLDVVVSKGYSLIGPTVRDGAVMYEPIRSADDLPRGYSDEQEPAGYELSRSPADTLFGCAVGPGSWKKYLFPPRTTVFSATRAGKGFTVSTGTPAESPPKLAFIGVRPCDLHAIGIQDSVFLSGDYHDPGYAAVRRNCLLVAVNCTAPGGSCFCGSLGSGPKANDGADLILTEVADDGTHWMMSRIVLRRRMNGRQRPMRFRRRAWLCRSG